MASVYAGSLTLRDARTLYFERNGIPRDGGYAKRWVKVTRGRLPLYLLNTAPRRRAVPYHDLHHVLTEYDTSNTGEAEISAWELAAGTSPHWMALLLDLGALGTGLLIAPRRTFRAFLRGRRSRSLYAESLSDELLAASLGAVRQRLGLDAAPGPVEVRDLLCFAGFSLAGVVTLVSFFLFAPILVLIGLLLR